MCTHCTFHNRTPEERFWSKVDPCRTDGCMIWVGTHNSDGYGHFRVGQRIIAAHHFLAGRPPKGLEWDHVKERGCTNRDCAWPEHLELVTHRENVLRGGAPSAFHARKTHCPQGHPYDESNTYVNRGKRACRACKHAFWVRRRKRVTT